MVRFAKDGDLKHQLDLILNNGIELGDNLRAAAIEFTTTGGVETIQHNLGYTPYGYLIVYQTGAVDLYAENVGSWNGQEMFLRSSVASVVVRLYVL